MIWSVKRSRYGCNTSVAHLRKWLEDDEVAENWFGRYAYSNPVHLGYLPDEMENVSDEEWETVFKNPEHRIISIYSDEGEYIGEHIGEFHVAIEETLSDGYPF